MEPEYTYVRGKGWVIQNVESFELELSGGRARLENRKPNTGERCARFNSREEQSNYIVDIKSNPYSYSIRYFPVFDYTDEGYELFLTVVPL